VLTPYLDLLRRPGTLRFSAAGFVQRLPMSMLGLGAVLFLTLRGSSYAVAGAVSAVGGLAGAVGGPLVGRAVDRFTQHRVLPLVVSAAVACQVSFVVLVLVGAPVWTWFLSFALGEGLVPNVGSLVRARWAHVLDDQGDVRTAFAFESVLDEVIFVLGPPLATLLAVSLVPSAAILAAIVLLTAGTALLVPQRRTEPPPAGPEHHEGKAAIRYTGIPLIFTAFLLLGIVFGGYEVVTVAFAAEHGSRATAGLLLAAYALGSAVAGLALGAIRPRIALPRQFLVAFTAVAVVALPFPFIGSSWLLGVLGFVAGLAVAPSLITGMSLTEQLVPAARLTEGLSMVVAGIALGFAVGASLAGPVIDAHGASAAYGVVTAAGLLAGAMAWVGYPRLRRAFVASELRDAEAAEGA
jgi:predicted MFS family arabinose efflux permease